MNEYLTAPKLAQLIGISDNTVRRYVKNYTEFFKKEFIDGYEQYPVDYTVELIKKINDISSAGKRRPTVIKELKEHFNEVVIEERRKETDNFKFGDTELLTSLNHNLNRIANALEKLARVGNA